MSHSYPLANSAEDALKPDIPAARTRAEAERLADGQTITALETEWLALGEAEAGETLAKASASLGQGFVQRYEDASGAPVLAVTFWKLEAAKPIAKAKPKAPKQVDVNVDGNAEKADETDHTDDLYFRSGRTKPRRKAKPIDPNQLDLFGSGKGEETG